MFKIGVIGSIGVGKSTFINYLIKEINKLGAKTYVYGEPAMEDASTHEILLKFYEDTKKYAFALEESITKVYNRYYEEIRVLSTTEKEGVVIIDGPSNGDIYSRIFYKNNIFTLEEKETILALVAPFEVDVMIYLQESAAETIRRIKKRDRGMEMANLDYIYDHVRDYQAVIPDYLKARFPHAKVLNLKDFPDVTSKDYDTFVKDLARLLTTNNEVSTIDFGTISLINA